MNRRIECITRPGLFCAVLLLAFGPTQLIPLTGTVAVQAGEDVVYEYDLGDAPDSSTSSPDVAMTAYPKGGPSGVAAHYPTVYEVGSPPHGPIHWQPRAVAFLGCNVSLETEADAGLDTDPTNNLIPLWDLPDRDGADDGLVLPLVLPHCQQTTFDYVVTVMSEPDVPLYVNVWCDWNRDGDWDDVLECADGTAVPEWAVQNQQPALAGVGTHTITTPPLLCWHPQTDSRVGPLWLRITLSEKPWEPSQDERGSGGAGPMDGYDLGETEDYYIYPLLEGGEAAYDWGDAPADANYPTLSADNGARHVMAGPWFGDAEDRPDAEADGRPDPNAIGDDTAGSDDENGVTIPPLYPGEPATITLDVSGGGGVVQAWIDFDRDGTWQPAEQVYNGYLPDGPQVMNLVVPDNAVGGVSFARFRISSCGGLSPDGPAGTGEVEDHAVVIQMLSPSITWRQWPDVTQNGIDIRVDSNDGQVRWLADDFGSISSDPITLVCLWGSWKDDKKGVIKSIRLSLYANDPAGPAGSDPDNEYAKPELMEPWWQESFDPNEFWERPYHVVRRPGEWWWDPATEERIPAGDMRIWQIDIPTSTKALSGSPDSPRIYWLAVQVETEGGQFGWKTRQWPYHDLEDAVWDVGTELPRIWKELRYPEPHPYHGLEENSVDMAFYLESRPCGPCVGPTCGAVTCVTCRPTWCATCATCRTSPTCGPTCTDPTCRPTCVTCTTCKTCATSCPTTCATCVTCVTCKTCVTSCPTTCSTCVTSCPTTCATCLTCPTQSTCLTCPTQSTCTTCPTQSTCLTCPTQSTCTTCPTQSTCVGCPTLSTCVGCPTLSTCVTCNYTCAGCVPVTIGCPILGRGNQPAVQASYPVVYTLQKDWLITDYTCPAIQVDCPAVVPEAVRLSEVDRPTEQPRISMELSEQDTSADS